jgi:hypothetical protein
LNQYKKVLKEQLLTEKKKSAQFLKEILKIGKILFAEQYPGISKLVEENVSVEIAHDLWLDHYVHTCQVSYTTTIILNSDNLVRQTILSRCTALDKSSILSNLKSQFIAAKLRGIDFLVRILSLIKNYFPDDYSNFQETIEDNLSSEIAHELWLGNFSNICQISYISSIILELEPGIKRIIFERCTEDDKLNIFFKVIYTYQKIDTDSKLQTIKKFLNLSKEFAPRQHEIFLNSVINICPDYFKLNLWLEDYYQTLDFHTYKLYTITLTQQDQKKFVKKVLKYIHEEKVAISIEELTSINVIDYETSEIGHQID